MSNEGEEDQEDDRRADEWEDECKGRNENDAENTST